MFSQASSTSRTCSFPLWAPKKPKFLEWQAWSTMSL
jgi:hypothetical protein